jgi:CheY-like chemotaxis protein
VPLKENGMSAKKSNATWTEPAGELFILHVEDNADDRTLFQMAADQTRNPIRWHSADSAEAAVNYLKGLEARGRDERVRWPDLMLLDIVMPLESGIKVLQFLSMNPTIKLFPVIVLTGSEDVRLVAEVREMGAQAICVKPQSFEQLTLFMDSLYRSWSRARLDTGPDIRPAKKFLVLCFSNAPDKNPAAFRAECERAGGDITWQSFDSLQTAWSHLQLLIGLKNMKTVNWPDLALLDLSNDDDAGWKLLRLIRSAPEFHGLPVVAFTPSGDRKSSARAHELGANSLAGKPQDLLRNVHLIKVLSSAWNIASRPTPGLSCETA